MFSGIFIDRPRLAFVVAIVITLAGIIAIQAIPIASKGAMVADLVALIGSLDPVMGEVDR